MTVSSRCSMRPSRGAVSVSITFVADRSVPERSQVARPRGCVTTLLTRVCLSEDFSHAVSLAMRVTSDRMLDVVVIRTTSMSPTAPARSSAAVSAAVSVTVNRRMPVHSIAMDPPLATPRLTQATRLVAMSADPTARTHPGLTLSRSSAMSDRWYLQSTNRTSISESNLNIQHKHRNKRSVGLREILVLCWWVARVPIDRPRQRDVA